MEQLTFCLVSGADARSIIAAHFARLSFDIAPLGSIELAPHQQSAAARLERAMDEFGGAMLCDPVGTGKTFVALALVPPDEIALVVAPAVLKTMWIQSAAMAARRIRFVSFESLSRGALAETSSSLLVVDEAHHARNPRTVRYEALSRLCVGRKVLIMTATPIHNRRRDLESLLALFAGSRSGTMTSPELARCVIRRERLLYSLASMPHTDEVIWCRVCEDDRIPSLLLDLPPPVPPRDGGDGGALVTHSLMRQWSSSDAALIGGLRRRLVRAEAMIAALEDGTRPSRSDLVSWISGEDAIQLTFSTLLASPAADTQSMLALVREHRDALRVALDLARTSVSDEARAAVIRRLRQSHRDRKVVVFTQYADTVDGMFRLLCRDGQAAALTGSGGRVAGGKISRLEVIEKFAPVASGVSPPRRAEEISLLITTDLLSEGVNLQDAGVVIHLDLPWTPARIAQRLGRLARLGSAHERVISYAFRPPATAEAITRIESILRRKLNESGIVTDALPSFGDWSSAVSPDVNSPLSDESLRQSISSWTAFETAAHTTRPAIAAVRAGHSGFLAAVSYEGRIRLVACVDGRVDDSIAFVRDAVSLCEGSDTPCARDEVHAATKRCIDWIQSQHAVSAVRRSGTLPSSGRSKAVRRIDRIVQNARRHERELLHRKAQSARQAAAMNFGCCAERELDTLCNSEHDGESWLDAIVSFGVRAAARSQVPFAPHGEIVAMLIFSPPSRRDP
jgi:superfamily II DNA or RNA helicase